MVEQLFIWLTSSVAIFWGLSALLAIFVEREVVAAA